MAKTLGRAVLAVAVGSALPLLAGALTWLLRAEVVSDSSGERAAAAIIIMFSWWFAVILGVALTVRLGKSVWLGCATGAIAAVPMALSGAFGATASDVTAVGLGDLLYAGAVGVLVPAGAGLALGWRMLKRDAEIEGKRVQRERRAAEHRARRAAG